MTANQMANELELKLDRSDSFGSPGYEKSRRPQGICTISQSPRSSLKFKENILWPVQPQQH